MLRDKTTSVNNARNTFETELKRQLATFEKDLHELKSQHNTEMQTMECNYTRQIREQHEKHQEIIAQYEARDEAWQNEKEVCNKVIIILFEYEEQVRRFFHTLSKKHLFIENTKKSLCNFGTTMRTTKLWYVFCRVVG